MKLTEAQLVCLKQANMTFGYREFDNRPVFQSLKSMGMVYETVRALEQSQSQEGK